MANFRLKLVLKMSLLVAFEPRTGLGMSGQENPQVSLKSATQDRGAWTGLCGVLPELSPAPGLRLPAAAATLGAGGGGVADLETPGAAVLFFPL